jgi:hypothetical protein
MWLGLCRAATRRSQLARALPITTHRHRIKRPRPTILVGGQAAEHVLLGFSRVTRSLREVFASFEIEPATAREAVDKTRGRGDPGQDLTELRQRRRARSSSLHRTRPEQAGASVVDTEHVLLGLLRAPAAEPILGCLRLSTEAVRQKVLAAESED